MIQRDTTYRLLQETQMILYTKRVQDACDPFSCGNGKIEQDLNDFFSNDADLYREELLGKTYCFITKEKPYHIVGLFTISNDSIKTTYLDRSTSNRLNRHINNAKRGRSYPAVLIGRQVQLDSSRTCVYWNDEIDLASDSIYEYGKAA